MMEWRKIKGFEEQYEISEFGDVKSFERNGTKGGPLKCSIDRYGYRKVVLHKGDKPHYFTVHRLVALNFLENNEGKQTVNHIDCNKLNNHFSNLEWMTNIENLDHSFEMGRQRNPKQPILATEIETGIQKIFPSQKAAARGTGIKQGTIHYILKGVRTNPKYTFERVKEN